MLIEKKKADTCTQGLVVLAPTLAKMGMFLLACDRLMLAKKLDS